MKLWRGFFVQIHLFGQYPNDVLIYNPLCSGNSNGMRLSRQQQALRGVAQLLTPLRTHGVCKQGFHIFAWRGVSSKLLTPLWLMVCASKLLHIRVAWRCVANVECATVGEGTSTEGKETPTEERGTPQNC